MYFVQFVAYVVARHAINKYAIIYFNVENGRKKGLPSCCIISDGFVIRDPLLSLGLIETNGSRI